jgi:hypothetical protein
MKIERTWFEGADPHAKREPVAAGNPSYDFYPDGHVEIFVPLDGGPNGHVITLTREEVEQLQ